MADLRELLNDAVDRPERLVVSTVAEQQVGQREDGDVGDVSLATVGEAPLELAPHRRDPFLDALSRGRGGPAGIGVGHRAPLREADLLGDQKWV